VKSFETDLNHRERLRYAESLRQSSEQLAKAAEALINIDDTTAMVFIVTTTLTLPLMLSELLKILGEAASVAKAAEDLNSGERP
jgi:hypothetical protein